MLRHVLESGRFPPRAWRLFKTEFRHHHHRSSDENPGVARKRRPHVRQRETHRKARRVGPPSAVHFSRDSIMFKKPRTERPVTRRGTSAHQARSTLAETPPSLKVCPERPIARRGTSAHQARSPAQNAQQRETHRKARHVGPPSEANPS